MRDEGGREKVRGRNGRIENRELNGEKRMGGGWFSSLLFVALVGSEPTNLQDLAPRASPRSV